MKEKLKAYYIDLVEDKRKGALAALFSFLLLLLSFVYGFFVKLFLSCYRIKLFKSTKLDCRLISVGNITWGGTGKTPLVETLAKFLQQEGKNPTVLIRGYGKDEVHMLKDRFRGIPVLAGRNRIKTARYAQKRYDVDTIILDDGFQHWRLSRDLDIVLIDAKFPFGNGSLLPRGILREPLSSLGRADVFVLTNSDLAKEKIEPIKKQLRKYNQQAPIFEAKHAPHYLRSLTSGEKIDPSTIRNQRVGLLAGIAHPEYFEKTLDLLEARVSLRFFFLDHYRYKKKDLEKIEKQCLKHGIKTIITTEKDAARLKAAGKGLSPEIRLLALGIEFKIVKDQEKFFGLLKNNKQTQKPYSILVLNDGKAGHLNQAKAVAKIIKKVACDNNLNRQFSQWYPPHTFLYHQQRKIAEGAGADELEIKTVEVKFKNGFCRTLLATCSIFANPDCRGCLRCLRFCLKKDSFAELMQLPANIIVSAGSSLSSVNLFFSYKNNARSVVLMKPSFLNLDRFDLVIVPEHDRVKPKDNVLLTKIAPNLIDREYLQEQADILNTQYAIRNTQYETKGPTIGVLIGGDTPKYRLTTELMNKIVSQLKETAGNLDCRILVTTSRRTPQAVEKLLKDNLTNFEPCKLLVVANEKNIPEAIGGILGLSDIIVVSGESISMVSEAVSAGKDVLVFKPEKKVRAPSKQERFLEKLEREEILKIIQPESLSLKIEKAWKERPKRFKIQDKELIYQAVSRLLR